MILLPFDRFTIHTHLTAVQVRQKLMENTDLRPRTLINQTTDKLFRGQVNENAFILTPVIGYGSSFIPEIKGKISYEMGLTQVSISMAYLPIVGVLMAFWLIMSGGSSLFTFILFLGGQTPEAWTSTFAMFILGYAGSTLAYKIEALKAKKPQEPFT